MTLKAPECTLSGFTYNQSLMFQSFILTSCKGPIDSHNEFSFVVVVVATEECTHHGLLKYLFI